MLSAITALLLTPLLTGTQSAKVDLDKIYLQWAPGGPFTADDQRQLYRQTLQLFAFNDSNDTLTDFEFTVTVEGGGKKVTRKYSNVPCVHMNALFQYVMLPKSSNLFIIRTEFPYSVFYYGRNTVPTLTAARKIQNFSNLHDGKTMLAWFFKATPAQIEAQFKKDSSLANVKGSLGESPIQMALMQPDPAKVKALQRLGMKLNFVTRMHQNALHYAASSSPEMISYVASQGIKARKDYKGLTPIFYAVSSRSIANLRAMKKIGANPNEQTPSGMTPIMYAASMAMPSMVRELIKLGGNKNLRTHQGLSLLSYAMLHQEEVFDEFVKIMGSAKLKEEQGRSLLHVAVIQGHTHVIKYLMAKGLSPYQKDGDGLTCIDYANKITHPVNRNEMLKKLEPNKRRP